MPSGVKVLHAGPAVIAGRAYGLIVHGICFWVGAWHGTDATPSVTCLDMVASCPWGVAPGWVGVGVGIGGRSGVFCLSQAFPLLPVVAGCFWVISLGWGTLRVLSLPGALPSLSVPLLLHLTLVPMGLGPDLGGLSGRSQLRFPGLQPLCAQHKSAPLLFPLGEVSGLLARQQLPADLFLNFTSLQCLPPHPQLNG